MNKLFGIAALVAVAFAGPAMAFDAKLTVKQAKSQTGAEAAGGSQSSTGAIGGSALLGVTGISVTNSGVAAGDVKAKNTGNSSQVTQTYVSGNNTTIVGGSLGLAGSAGVGGGMSESIGAGAASTKVKTTSVKLHF